MIWDPCLARAVAAELEARLGGRRARAAAFHRDSAVAQLHLRDATVEVDLAAGRALVTLGPPTEPDPGAEPLPAVVAGVEAVPDERAVVMRLRRVRGRKPHPALIVELATNRWNALLAEGPELRVRKRLRTAGPRPAPIGRPWEPPGSGGPGRTGGPGRAMVDAAAWRDLVAGRSRSDARRALLTRVAHVSGLNVGWLLDAPDPGEGHRRWAEMAAGTNMAPHIMRTPRGLQPYPWPLPGMEAEPVGSLLEAMATAREAAAAEADDLAPGPVARALALRARRLRRRVANLRNQLEGAARAAALRDDAALILSSLHLIEPGAARVDLVAFDGSARTLELDPRTRPQEHAGALFRRAARLDRAAAQLPGRIAAAEEALAGVVAQQGRHGAGELGREEAAAILGAAAKTSGRGRGRDAGTDGRNLLPYKRFTSSGGLEIRVGRGARHNDDLTFRHARPGDVWLHARHAAGAHVILRWSRPERPPAADLEEAAVLAANRSEARGSAHVPVDWTRRKWVRKPRGSAPGAVVPERVETLFVTPDAGLEERLGLVE